MARYIQLNNGFEARGSQPAQAFATTGAQPTSQVAAQNTFSAAAAVGAAYLFFLFSHSIEFIDTTGRLHLIVLLALVGAMAALSAGQLPKVLTSAPGLCLSLFTLTLILGIPFSSWKGGSLKAFTDTWWKSYLTFFLVSGLIFTVGQMRRSLFVIASASIGILYVATKAARSYDDGRLSVEYGSLGNSNDLAGAILMCLPFVAYVILDKKRVAFVRLGFVGIFGMLLLTVMKTGSRASIVVIPLMLAMVFFKTSAANKAKLLVCCLVLICLIPIVVPKDLLARYKTIFISDLSSNLSDNAASAVMSTNARKQLVKNAIVMTIQHPIFGVGMGNFSFQSAELEVAKGKVPLWYTCHDIYLLVSSETGLAGLMLFLATIIFTAKILLRLEKTARNVPDLEGVSQMAFCILLSLIAYAACGIFNTNAYTMQMPALAGLAVALDRITKPLLARAEEKRMEQFRQAIPVSPSRFAGAAAAAVAYR